MKVSRGRAPMRAARGRSTIVLGCAACQEWAMSHHDIVYRPDYPLFRVALIGRDDDRHVGPRGRGHEDVPVHAELRPDEILPRRLPAALAGLARKFLTVGPGTGGSDAQLEIDLPVKYRWRIVIKTHDETAAYLQPEFLDFFHILHLFHDINLCVLQYNCLYQC